MSDDQRELEIWEGRRERRSTTRWRTPPVRRSARSIANDGRQYVIVQHVVTVSNPRISEHKVTLAGGDA